MRSIVGKLSTKVDAPAALARRIGAELDSRLQRKHRFCDELSNALMNHSISRRNSMRIWLSVRKTPRMTEDVIRPGIRIPRAEKCLHKTFMEILSRGDVSATQS